MEGSYTDENTKFTVADLGTITPIEWIRLATPIVLHPGIPMIRREMANSLSQDDDTTFISFLMGLERTCMVVGIHSGWGLQIGKEKILERFPQALNKKLHDSYLKKFTLAYIEPDRYEEVVAHLKQVDGWRNVEHRTSVVRNNPFQTMILKADAANQIRRRSKGQVPGSSANTQKREPSRSGVEAQFSMSDSKKTILKENRSLQARIKQLEAQQNLPAQEETPTVAVIDVSCKFCRRRHPWPAEECYGNPNCTIPKDQRKPRSKPNSDPKSDPKKKGKGAASK